MNRNLTTDDIEGMPHVVIIETDQGIKMVEFEGENSVTDANVFAYSQVRHGFDGRIIVAVRYHQIGNFDYAKRTNTGICR